MTPQDSLLHAIYDELRDARSVQWISYVGNAASVIGLAITIIVLIIAQKVKSFFYRYDRIPKLREAIKNCRAQIGDYLNMREIPELPMQEQLAICISHLRSLKKKVPRRFRGAIKNASRVAEAIRSRATIRESRDGIQDIYSSLIVIENDIQNHLSDMRGEGIQ